MRRLAALTLLIMFAPSATAADWPQWLGPSRDGSTSEVVKSWTEPLKPLWRVKVGEGHSSPVVAGNLVVLHAASSSAVDDAPAIKSKTEYVTAYDAATGAVKWVGRMEKKPFSSEFGNGPRATPAIADGKIFCYGVTGTFAAFDLVSGKLLADPIDVVEENKAKVPYFGVSASPLVESGHVVLMVGGPEAGLVGIDINTLKPTTKWLKDPASYSAPIAIGDGAQRQIVTLTSKGLYGLPPSGGEQFWAYRFVDLLSESSTTPIRVGDLLIGSSVTLGSVALKIGEKEGKPSVEEAWKNGQLSCYFSTPIAVGKEIFLVTGRLIPPPTATLHCVEAATGKILWKRPNVGKYGATLVRTGDNKLLLLEEKGDLVLLNPDRTKFSEPARSKICGETWAHFAVAGGRLYVRDRSELFCYELPH